VSAGDRFVNDGAAEKSPTQRESFRDIRRQLGPANCTGAQSSGFYAAGFVRVYRQVRMPSSEAILSGLTAIANEWQQLALAWHAWLATLTRPLGITARRGAGLRAAGWDRRTRGGRLPRAEDAAIGARPPPRGNVRTQIAS
jgi:hypothetical protein